MLSKTVAKFQVESTRYVQAMKNFMIHCELALFWFCNVPSHLFGLESAYSHCFQTCVYQIQWKPYENANCWSFPQSLSFITSGKVTGTDISNKFLGDTYAAVQESYFKNPWPWASQVTKW